MEWVFIVILWVVTLFFTAFALGMTLFEEGGIKWGLLVGALVFILISCYWTRAIIKRRSTGIRKANELVRQLETFGIQASIAEKGLPVQKIGSNNILGRRCEAVLELTHRDIQYVSITTEMRNGWGMDYAFNYLVSGQAFLARKKRLGYEKYLIPEPKYGYIRIKYPDELPSRELFNEIENLAKQIKSGSLDLLR